MSAGTEWLTALSLTLNFAQVIILAWLKRGQTGTTERLDALEDLPQSPTAPVDPDPR